MLKTLLWEDWAGIALGTWMLMSPWVVGYSAVEAATMNALVMGTILVLEEMLDLGVHEALEEWIDIAVGFWLVVSPFALGFVSSMAATVNAIVVGGLTVVLAVQALADGPVDTWDASVMGH
jgi:hypothetical protein